MGVAGLKVSENPNRSAEEKPMTRKQQEQADRERKAAEYRRRHELGLTDEYKRDMAKLELVKKRRADAAAREAAEKEAAESLEGERKAQQAAQAAAAAGSDSEDEEKTSKKKKKKKPALLKEALKERGLEVQGNAKTLTARLLEFE